jgi:hypothetical protein
MVQGCTYLFRQTAQEIQCTLVDPSLVNPVLGQTWSIFRAQTTPVEIEQVQLIPRYLDIS